jgi:hypothetical protein
MLNGLEIGLYDKKDREQCIRLLESCFPGTSNEKTFAWRFESPVRPEPLMVCAKHEGKVVGFNAWLPWEFNYRGKTYLAYQSGESATDTEYRRYGIFMKILHHANKIALDRGLDFYFGFPSPPTYPAGLKAGYHDVTTHNYYVRPLLSFYRKRVNHSQKKSELSLNRILIQEDKITPLVDENYCSWRYDANPKDYETFQYSEGVSSMTAYLRRINRKGFAEYLLLDSQFTSLNDAFVERAIKRLDHTLPRNTLYLWTFFNDNSDRGRALKKHFPIKMKGKCQYLFVMNVSKRLNPSVIFNTNCWDIMPHNVDWL